MKWPFSAYDLFAHLASGATILTAAAFSSGRDIGEVDAVLQVGVFSIAAYTIGHIVAQLSSTLMEQGLIARLLGTPEERLMIPGGGLGARFFPGYFAPLPAETSEALRARLKSEGCPTTPGEAMFLHCWSIVRSNADVRQRLDSFLNLYGFSRNMAVATLLSVFIVSAGAVFGDTSAGDATLVGLSLSCASIVLVYRYLKFFRLYTREVLVRYVTHSDQTLS